MGNVSSGSMGAAKDTAATPSAPTPALSRRDSFFANGATVNHGDHTHQFVPRGNNVLEITRIGGLAAVEIHTREEAFAAYEELVAPRLALPAISSSQLMIGFLSIIARARLQQAMAEAMAADQQPAQQTPVQEETNTAGDDNDSDNGDGIRALFGEEDATPTPEAEEEETSSHGMGMR